MIHGLYQHRPPYLLLRQSERNNYEDAAPSAGLATVHNARAQAFAMVGSGDQAVREIQRSASIFECLPAEVTRNTDSVAGWAEDRLRYTQAWVYAHLGQARELDDAVDATLRLLPISDRRSRAQIQLLQAFGHIQSGDVTAGIQRAHQVYAAHPVEQRTTFVTQLAAKVLDAVPAVAHSEAVTRDYRELVAPVPKAIT
jgi:hypothetical protein